MTQGWFPEMRWHYNLFSIHRSLVQLGGRWVRPRPYVIVSAIGPAGTVVREALIDSGSDDTVFPDSVATLLGLDLSQAPHGVLAGIGQRPVQIRYARINLRLSDGQEHREWLAWVGFTNQPLRRPLLGFAGFLQFFTATFHGDLEEVELTVNRLYPGT